tara:strand:+ start:79 stop:537 length:459 start_codon:yes stop_codon:yes gene_type:complete
MEIQGYNNYLISKDGRVYSKIKNRFLKPVKNKDGYVFVGLRNDEGRKHVKIHRLVAIHYIPNPENKPEVNHKDGNKSNNDITNLEWMTRNENCNAFKKTPKNNKYGVKNIHFNKNHNLWIYQKIHYGKRFVKYFQTFEEACEYKRNFEITLN